MKKIYILLTALYLSTNVATLSFGQGDEEYFDNGEENLLYDAPEPSSKPSLIHVKNQPFLETFEAPKKKSVALKSYKSPSKLLSTKERIKDTPTTTASSSQILSLLTPPSSPKRIFHSPGIPSNHSKKTLTPVNDLPQSKGALFAKNAHGSSGTNTLKKASIPSKIPNTSQNQITHLRTHVSSMVAKPREFISLKSDLKDVIKRCSDEKYNNVNCSGADLLFNDLETALKKASQMHPFSATNLLTTIKESIELEIESHGGYNGTLRKSLNSLYETVNEIDEIIKDKA